jgi:hypothetical protein
MMRKFAIVTLLGVAACGSGNTVYSTGSVSPLALQPPPIYSLFGYRESLGLTSEQVESLDSIARAVKERNDPVVDSLRAIADSRSGRSRGIILINDVTRPMLERVGANNREAAEEVQEILTETQEREVCELVDERVRERERNDRSDRQRQEVARRDSALFMPLLGTWPWCRAG